MHTASLCGQWSVVLCRSRRHKHDLFRFGWKRNNVRKSRQNRKAISTKWECYSFYTVTKCSFSTRCHLAGGKDAHERIPYATKHSTTNQLFCYRFTYPPINSISILGAGCCCYCSIVLLSGGMGIKLLTQFCLEINCVLIKTLRYFTLWKYSIENCIENRTEIIT